MSEPGRGPSRPAAESGGGVLGEGCRPGDWRKGCPGGELGRAPRLLPPTTTAIGEPKAGPRGLPLADFGRRQQKERL